MRSGIFKLALLLSLIFNINADLFSQASDYAAKAVALEKLAMFITWPGSHTDYDQSGTFIIAVLNNKSFGKNLEEVYGSRKIKNKIVQVLYLDNIQKLKKCDLLYISNTSVNELKAVISAIQSKRILTIGDVAGFAEAGGFINLYEFENKLRFEINQKGMQDAGFKVDYRLLRVSKVLNPVIE